jgi:hypothetical protein
LKGTDRRTECLTRGFKHQAGNRRSDPVDRRDPFAGFRVFDQRQQEVPTDLRAQAQGLYDRGDGRIPQIFTFSAQYAVGVTMVGGEDSSTGFRDLQPAAPDVVSI